MSEQTERKKTIGWLMVVLGGGLLITVVGFAAALLGRGPTLPSVPTLPPVARDEIAGRVTSVAVERRVPLLPSRTPTATITPSPAPTKQPTVTPTLLPTNTVIRPSPVPIEWTTAEKNALSWLCYGEISGMGSSEYDACLSVISTVRARYAYTNGFTETDVIGTLRRPNQFNVPIETAEPAPPPRFLDYVEDYAQGARGSCNGYLFFNSIPGGPAECVIRGAGGLFMQFHNSP